MDPCRPKTTARSVVASVVTGILALATLLVPVRAGTLTANFSSDPGGTPLGRAKIDNGILKLQDLQELIDGEASLPMHGSYVFPEIDGGAKVASFVATFRASIHGGTEQGAQGFSFVLANDIEDRTSPFRESGGGSQGLVISFDTIDNLAGFEAEGNQLGDAPGIIIRIGNQRVAAQRFNGLRTGSPNNQTPTFVPVEIRLDPDGTLDVTYNGVKVYDNFPIPYAPIAGNFGFGAGTAELTAALRDNHWIDDLSITTTTVSGAHVLSALPLGATVRPDARVEIQLQDLAGASVALQFNGATVQPTVATAGAVTTVTYDPPGTLAPGSTHEVQLTYGDKTLRYAFTVVSAPVIPAAFAVPAATVATAQSGFTVRVHQLESAPPGGNTADRVERQLAGEYGENIADISLGVGDGSFLVDVINFEQDGFDAGLVNSATGHPDDFIPGIPGLLGTYDYIAMEIIGYLDLAPGAYTFGAVSDDNFRLTIGDNPRDVTALRLLDTPIGTVRGTFIIEQAGIYPVRGLWGEGVGGAHIEFWLETPTGEIILINDRSTPGHVRSYRARAAGYQAAPYLSAASPAPGEANVSTAPTVRLQLTETGPTVNAASIQVALNGQTLTLPEGAVSKQGAVTTIEFRPATALEPLADQTLRLSLTDSAGTPVIREYTFTTGRAAAGNLANAVKGYWNFSQGNLAAVIGRDLQYIDASLASRYAFGTTAALGIPAIDGQPARVLHIPYTPGEPREVFSKIGLRMQHTITPNGGGQKVNQWTLIMDVLWGPEGQGFGGLLQTHDFDNPTDGDLFWRASDGSYGKGCCSIYDGLPAERSHRQGEWARVVFVVDLTANPPRLAKFINGYKHREDLTGDGGTLDGRYGLPPEVFLFGDGDDNERTEAFVNAIQIREGIMSDEEVAALGGASANGIPIPYAQWDFEAGNLAATVGNDLEYIDSSLANRYAFGTTTALGIPDIAGRPARVIHIPYTPGEPRDVFSKIGLRMHHGLGANAGGQKLNQWTLVMDVLWGPEGQGFGGLLQTHDFDNPTDGDLFWRASDGSYGKGCCSIYDGLPAERSHRQGEWARVVFVADLTANPPRLAKFINGYKHREDLTGDGGTFDGRYGLPSQVFLFGDGDDNERTEAFVNSIQIQARALSDDEVIALGGPSASGIPTPNPVKGEWNFDQGNLAATVGRDLRYIDNALASRYAFGTTTALGIPNINGMPARVIHIPYTPGEPREVFSRIGLRMEHLVPPNGGGQKANQWTLILDLLWGPEGQGFGGLLQTHDFDNPTDGDLFWRASDGSYGKGCCSIYDGLPAERSHRQGEWARVVFVADIAANPPRLAKFINGYKHREDVTGDGGTLDGRYGLPPEIFLFGDGDDNERTEAFVNAIQIREGALTDDEVAILGGPSAFGIPSAASGSGGGSTPPPPTAPEIALTVNANGTLTLTWTGNGFTLESTGALGGTWTPVAGVTGTSATLTPTGAGQFYRLRQ
ncbi:MAG: hypothetical protein KF833_14405 [Verrucomicrobiae bacterium]|nr:hypothetical protein [Verrucomicrobiae bacterium]